MKSLYKVSMAVIAIAAMMLTSCYIEDPYENIDNTRYSATDNFSHEVKVAGQKCLKLSGINGSIDIVGVSEDGTVRVWGERKVGSESYEDAEYHLERLQVNVTTLEDEILIKTEQPSNTHGRSYTVTYHVRVPRYLDICVHNVNGEIFIDDTAGGVTLALVNGNIQLREVKGEVLAETTNGNIDGKIILPQKGICRLITVNGNIKLTIPKSTSAYFSASTVNGSVQLHELTLMNQSGSRTTMKGRLGDGEGTISIQTVNGNITAEGY